MSADLAVPVIDSRDHIARQRGRLTTLAQFGIAAEPFPDYVNPVLDLHGLDVVLLTFVLAGEGHHVMGDTEYPVNRPSFGITRTGEQHTLLTGEGSMDVVNVYLDVEAHPLPSLAPPLDVVLAALVPFSASVSQRPIRLAQVALDDIDEVTPVLQQLVAETMSPRAGTGDALDALRKLLLTACARAIIAGGFITEEAPRGASAGSIENVRNYLERTYVERHTLDELAAMAHLERTYFSRMFAAHTGLPVTEYIARLRIRYAIAQLQGSDRPVSEIAATSGFRDLSHFGRTFRRYTGTSPHAYRLSHAKLADRRARVMAGEM